MQEDVYQNRIKFIKLIAVIFALICIIAVIFAISSVIIQNSKHKVTVKFAPYDSVVMIDNEAKLTNNADNYITLGTHSVTVYRSGFELYTKTVEVTEDTDSIYGSLTSCSSLGDDLTTEKQTEFQSIEGAAGTESTKEYEQDVEKWPIVKYLPYSNSSFGIGYDLDLTTDDTLYLTISADSYVVDAAVNKLRSFDSNISLAQYPLRINNFSNILENKLQKNSNSDPTTFIEDGYKNLGYKFDVNSTKSVDDYFLATLVVNIDAKSDYTPITFREILKKSGQTWEEVGTPYPIRNTYNAPDTSTEIIDEINKLDAKY